MALDDFALLTVVQKAVDRERLADRGARRRRADRGAVAERPARSRARARPHAAHRPLRRQFGRRATRAALARVLEANPHGVDLGPLQPRLPEVLKTPSGTIELAPEAIVADVEARLVPSLDRRANGEMVLVGRRDLRSNNSWMHNVEILVKGKPRCTLQIHPDDATRLRRRRRRAAPGCGRGSGEVEIPAEVTDGIMPGVVSIPHGWGHDAAGADMDVALRYAGVNSNVLADAELMDPLSGNSVLNGIPVTVEALVPPPPDPIELATLPAKRAE